MTSRQVSLAIVATVAIAFPTPQASAQCEPTWGLEILSTSGLRGGIDLLTACDIGKGPSLYAAGFVLTANGVDLNGIAVFDGVEWKPLGSGLNGTVLAMLPFDDGSGPALYVGGSIGRAGSEPVFRLGRWNGSNWHGIPGVPGTVSALGIHDDGNGPALYAASVVSTSGPAVTQIARWTGTSWITLGANLTASIRALQSFDDGHSQTLFAAGSRVAGISTTVPIMYRWSGAAWVEQAGATAHPSDGTITNAFFRTLQTFDDGSGPALYAAGWFSWAGSQPIRGIARWNGTDWFAVGTGIDGAVLSILPIHEAQGDALYACGAISIPGTSTPSYILRWKDEKWTPAAPNTSAVPTSIAQFNVRNEQVLCAGISNGDGVRWLNAGVWQPLASGRGGITGYSNFDRVFAEAAYDDGTGPALYVGGNFALAGGAQMPYLVRWTGSEFTSVGGGILGVVSALRVFDDGSGPALYVGGKFQSAGGVPARNVARWNGKAWSALGDGIGNANEGLWDFEVFDDGRGPALYAAGTFSTASGKLAHNIARWNGNQWEAVGSGTDDVIYRLKSFTNSSGSGLYATGRFFSAGGVDARALARWDGKSWSSVGSGLTMPSDSGAGGMQVFDDGSGQALYVSGYFTAAGSVPANNIARWNGLAWSPVGDGLDGGAWALTPFDDGSGPALYAGGYFTGAGGSSASRIARWNGTIWRPVGTGLYEAESGETVIFALESFDDGHGPGLFLGGRFNAVDGHFFQNIAKLIHAAPDSPSILAATPSREVCAGTPVVLSVTAVGTPPLTYQWRRNKFNLPDGTGVSGTNTPQLTLTAVAPDLPLNYDCVVTDAECQVISAPAWVTASSGPPLVMNQQHAQVVHAGDQVAFYVTVMPYSAVSYQWRKNGQPLAPSVRIYLTDSSYLTIFGAVPSDAGLYDCVITNPCGTTTSNAARLTVLASVPPPAKPIGPIPANPG